MHWYPKYTSDFIGATLDLSYLEKVSYGWMLDVYYERVTDMVLKLGDHAGVLLRHKAHVAARFALAIELLTHEFDRLIAVFIFVRRSSLRC